MRIPLVVGTTSLLPARGYAVPPGEWGRVTPLDLADGRRLVSGPKAFTVAP